MATHIDPSTWFSGILNRFLTYLVWPFFFGAAIVMIIIAGFLFLTAHGDTTKISSAKKALVWAVIGIFVGILAFSAPTLINNIISPTTTP